MTLRIRQIVLAASDLEKTVDQLTSVLGVPVCYRDPEVAKFGLENALMVIGDQFLEVVSPTQSNTAAGRHLDRHGDSGYMLILQTDDLERERKRIDELKVRVVWESNRTDISAFHLHPKDIGAAIVSIDQPIPPEAWPWAGPGWEKISKQQNTQQILSATVGAIDSEMMAHRWATVLGTKSPVSRNEGGGIDTVGGELLFETAAADVLSGFGIAVSDPQKSLVLAKEKGFEVDDNKVTICGTRFCLMSI